MNGWYLTELNGDIRVAPSKDGFDGPQQLSIKTADARARGLFDVMYWSAPASYLQDKVSFTLLQYFNLLWLLAAGFSKKWEFFFGRN